MKADPLQQETWNYKNTSQRNPTSLSKHRKYLVNSFSYRFTTDHLGTESVRTLTPEPETSPEMRDRCRTGYRETHSKIWKNTSAKIYCTTRTTCSFLFRYTEITAGYLFCRTFLENPEWSQKQETKRRRGAEVRFTVGLSRRCPLTAASGACQEVLFYLDGEKLQKWLRSFIKCSIANEHQIKCFHWKVGNVGKEKDIKLKFKNGAEREEVWPQNGPSTSCWLCAPEPRFTDDDFNISSEALWSGYI